MSMLNILVSIILTAILAGCTASTPEITSLASDFRFFQIDRKEMRLQTAADLTTITITAKCLMNQTEFWYELPDLAAPVPWTLVPTAPSAPFVSVTNNCASSRSVEFVLDLSSYSDFTALLSNSSLKQVIRFRDTNITGLSTEQQIEFYSSSKAPTERFILGGGINNPVDSGTFRLRGRITSLAVNQEAVSGTYSLRGRVVVDQ